MLKDALVDTLVESLSDSDLKSSVLVLVERDSETIRLCAPLPEILSLEICDPTSEIEPDTESDTDKDAASCSASFSPTGFTCSVSSASIIFCSPELCACTLLKNLGARLTETF